MFDICDIKEDALNFEVERLLRQGFDARVEAGVLAREKEELERKLAKANTTIVDRDAELLALRKFSNCQGEEITASLGDFRGQYDRAVAAEKTVQDLGNQLTGARAELERQKPKMEKLAVLGSTIGQKYPFSTDRSMRMRDYNDIVSAIVDSAVRPAELAAIFVRLATAAKKKSKHKR